MKLQRLAGSARPANRGVRPNLGVAAAYQRALERALTDGMNALHRETLALYAHSILATDSVITDLRDKMDAIGKRWAAQLAALAPALAAHFASRAASSVDSSLASILREGGLTVNWRMTQFQREALQALIGENVALIRNLPTSHLAQVEGSVMRAAARGGDLFTLSRELREHHGVTMKRAAFIAHDQNRRATSVLDRSRCTELGITEAIWKHSRAGKVPRPSHVAFSNKRYNVVKGAYLEGKQEWPGSEIGCRCYSVPVIPGIKYD